MRKEETEVEFRSIYRDFRAFSSWTMWVRCTLEIQKLSCVVAAASYLTCKGQVSMKTMILWENHENRDFCDPVAKIISMATWPYPGERGEKDEATSEHGLDL